MSLALITLATVFLLIAIRRLGRLRVAIWHSMSAGALVVLAGGAISPAAAWAAIDGEVMAFLFGVFVVGQALVESGWLFAASTRLLSRFGSARGLLLGLILYAGLGSAILMNDTLAVIGAPLVLMLAREHRLPPELLGLALAFAVTTGSVMSPIGNPQNLLIALGGGMPAPFSSFIGGLWLPTLLSLGLVYGMLAWVYRRRLHDEPVVHREAPLHDPALARLAQGSLALLGIGIGVKIAGALWFPDLHTGLAWIALLAAAPVLIASPRRCGMVRAMDWHTLIFFAAMFVLMGAVWQAPEVQSWVGGAPADPSPAMIYVLSLGLSQLVSNVPLVSLWLPLLAQQGAGEPAMLALAAGSTLAGNLLLMGAASNVIIALGLERQGVHLGFLRFALIGAPLTLLQSLVFLAWLG